MHNTHPLTTTPAELAAKAADLAAALRRVADRAEVRRQAAVEALAATGPVRRFIGTASDTSIREVRRLAAARAAAYAARVAAEDAEAEAAEAAAVAEVGR